MILLMVCKKKVYLKRIFSFLKFSKKLLKMLYPIFKLLNCFGMMTKKILKSILSWLEMLLAATLTRYRMGVQKGPHASFSSLISTKVGISPKNFLTFCFNLIVPFLNLNKDYSSKELIFLVKSLYSWGYNNFSHRKPRVIKHL